MMTKLRTRFLFIFALMTVTLLLGSVCVSAAVPKASIKKVSPGPGALTVQVNPVSKMKYQLAYKVHGTSSWTIQKPVKKKKIALKNLEKGVKYDIRVRCVSTGKKTRYGKWSRKKTCKTFRYNPKDFAGRWKCLYEVGDPEIGPTWLELEIRPNGKFHTVDIGAGNPGIAGTYKQYSDKTVHINCSKDGDFDPYWKKLKRVSNIRFKVISNDELHFTYKNGKKNSTLVFGRSKTA